MTYSELKKQQSDEFDNFPCFFAFSDSQFENGLKKLNATIKEVCKGPGGMILKKTDAGKLKELFLKRNSEMEEHLKDQKFLLDAVIYELANHEFGYTYDLTDTIDALGLDTKTMSPEQSETVRKAVEMYLEAEEA